MLSERETRDAIAEHQEFIDAIRGTNCDAEKDAEAIFHRVAILCYKYVLGEGPSPLLLMMEKTCQEVRDLLHRIAALDADRHSTPN